MAEASAYRRVRAVVACGRAMSDPATPLGREVRRDLHEQGLLSAEGIDLVLTRHLETSITNEHLKALVRSAAPAPHCWVVLAANVCTAPLRALAIGVAGCPRITVRASTRAPGIGPLLAKALGESADFGDAGGSIALATELAPTEGDLVHVYGTDETIATIRDRWPTMVIYGHGTGFGVAYVPETIEPMAAAASLVEALVPFDGRGCLSPRAIVAPGSDARLTALAEATRDALKAINTTVPLGNSGPSDLAERTRFAATLSMLGDVVPLVGGTVAIQRRGNAPLLAPPPRGVTFVAASVPWPQAICRHISSLGWLGEEAHALSWARQQGIEAEYLRRSELRNMQRPPLDGPVDRRPLLGSD